MASKARSKADNVGTVALTLEIYLVLRANVVNPASVAQ